MNKLAQLSLFAMLTINLQSLSSDTIAKQVELANKIGIDLDKLRIVADMKWDHSAIKKSLERFEKKQAILMAAVAKATGRGPFDPKLSMHPCHNPLDCNFVMLTDRELEEKNQRVKIQKRKRDIDTELRMIHLSLQIAANLETGVIKDTKIFDLEARVAAFTNNYEISIERSSPWEAAQENPVLAPFMLGGIGCCALVKR